MTVAECAAIVNPFLENGAVVAVVFILALKDILRFRFERRNQRPEG